MSDQTQTPDPAPRNRSRAALDLAAPTLKTRRARVLDCLERGKDQWIPGEVLRSPAVGGSEALRRVRELTAAGHPIARKPTGGKRTSWLYKLTTPEPAPVADSRQMALPLEGEPEVYTPSAVPLEALRPVPEEVM